ncbi:MAG TPA: asparagine synthase (glutamine-hydrolyzing) [Ignavibacteria bacterium]
MCGISGIFNIDNTPISVELLQKMANSIRHRGPDDEGFLLVNTINGGIEHRYGNDTISELKSKTNYLLTESDFKPNLGFGYRRLSILDLSSNGHQPMTNIDGSLWIEYNGEIYNYIEIKEELLLKGYKFRSNTDTEVILNAYEEWGFDCLKKFNGMWAFAIWDNKKKLLFCARDRFGVKPFYYYFDNKKFVFASEIKAILQDKTIKREINEPLIFDYFILNLIDHTNETFFKNIYNLPPSHFLILDSTGIKINKYYELSYNDEYEDFDENKLIIYSNKLKEILFDAVKLRFRADVPVGSCLSGGLDSSTIVCLGKELLKKTNTNNKDKLQHTFSAVYNDEKISEKKFVDIVIKKTGVNGHFVYPNSDILLNEIEDFIYHQEEPFLSTSMYAQWNVMRLAKQNKVTVLLDGQGSDEIFGGYEWHLPIYYAELFKKNKLKRLYIELNKISKLRNKSILKTSLDTFSKVIKPALPINLRLLNKAEAQIFNKDFINKYCDRINIFKKSDTNLQKRLFEEETKYNLQQLLRYEDRNSMAFSIEARVPFVDYRVVEFVMSIPITYKIYNGWSKYILRKAMEGILPPEIQWRKDKMGFVTPEKEWIKKLNIISTSNIDSTIFIANREIFKKRQYNKIDSLFWKFNNFSLWTKKFNLE